MNVLITLDSILGIDLGPNFNITANVGVVVPSSATLTQLINGISVETDDLATILYISSTGACTNTLELLITGIPTTTTTTLVPITTTTTTTAYVPINYGALYNWWAATDARNISASGWHVPDYLERNTLVSYIGGTNQGGKLKETGTTYWDSPNTSATNEVGFNGRSGGLRQLTTFSGIRMVGYWGTTTYWNYWGAEYNNTNIPEGNPGFDQSGLSLRLIKNTTTLSNGQSGKYVGNDGKIYRTICIGTQEWLADNLAETKFRNGDWITGFDGGVYTPISNSAWAAKTTEAMCVYDDNLANM